MNEYISREAVNNLIEDMQNNRLLLVCERTNLYILKSKVAELPTADVQPVNHGRWIHIRGCWWQCSNCENNLIYTMSDRGRTEKHRYCSKCGARMDGDAEGRCEKMNDVIKVLQQVSDTCGVTKYCARCDMFNDDTGVCVFADMPYLWDFEKLEEVLKEGAKNE